MYQFIGQDNLYFYGVAQPALWMALESGNAEVAYPQPGDLQQTTLIANHHILFGNGEGVVFGRSEASLG